MSFLVFKKLYYEWLKLTFTLNESVRPSPFWCLSSELLSEKLSLPNFSLLILNLPQVHVGPEHDFCKSSLAVIPVQFEKGSLAGR